MHFLLYNWYMFNFGKKSSQPIAQEPAEKKEPQVVFSVDTMKLSVSSSEKMAHAIRKELIASSEVITRARLQSSHLGELQTELKNVSSSADGINASIKEIDNLIDEENDAIQNVSSSVQQIAASLENVAQIVTERKKVTDTLASASESGSEKVNKVLSVIQTLNENVGMIKDVIASINEISEQTNLLAMNAAIEASHAGTAGLGFAVVASEIKKLSEITRKNSADIQRTLQEMINTLNTAKTTAADAGDSMKMINGQVVQTSTSFTEINNNMNELSQGGGNIKMSVTALSHASSDLREKSADMTKKAQGVASSIDHLASSGTSVLEQAQSISQLSSDQIFSIDDVIAEATQIDSFIHTGICTDTTKPCSSGIPFTGIMLKHLRWVTKVRAVIDGKITAESVKLSDHHSCDLGKWIDGNTSGTTELSKNPVFQQLSQVHEKMHSDVKRIFTEKDKMTVEQLESEYTNLLKTSGEVIDLLIKLK